MAKRLSPIQTANLKKAVKWLRKNPNAQCRGGLCEINSNGEKEYCIQGVLGHIIGLRTRRIPRTGGWPIRIEYQMPNGRWVGGTLSDKVLRDHLFNGLMSKPLPAPVSKDIKTWSGKSIPRKLNQLIHLNDAVGWKFEDFADWFDVILEKYGSRRDVVSKKVKYPKKVKKTRRR